MNEFITSSLKGFYPYFAIPAFIIVIYRVRKKLWTRSESLLLLFVILHLVFEALQILIGARTLYMSRRYLLPCAPLLFGWCAWGIAEFHHHLKSLQYSRYRVAFNIILFILTVILLIDGLMPTVKSYTSSEKSHKRKIVETLTPLLREDYKGYGRELALNYHISQRTAITIIQELAQKGVLQVSSGRRAQVRLKKNLQIGFDLVGLVAIVVSEVEFVENWRTWLRCQLQEHLKQIGCQTFLLTDNFSISQIHSKQYASFIVISEKLSDYRWKIIQQTGLPCVRLSFIRPYSNTVYIDERIALDKLGLFLVTRKYRKIILLSSDLEEDDDFGHLEEVGFLKLLRNYGIVPKRILQVSAIAGQIEENISRLHAAISGRQEKFVFLSQDSSYNDLIINIMKNRHQTLGIDYEIISLRYIPDKANFSPHIDLKYSEVINNILEIIHLQGKSYVALPGKVIIPDFKDRLSK